MRSRPILVIVVIVSAIVLTLAGAWMRADEPPRPVPPGVVTSPAVVVPPVAPLPADDDSDDLDDSDDDDSDDENEDPDDGDER